MVISEIFTRIKKYGELVMFSHSLFSLPFGLIAMIWASHGLPRLSLIVWILIALIAARTAANGYNRIADRFIDAKNERTAARHLPAGKIKVAEAYVLVIFSLAVLAFATYEINLLCLILLPFAIALMLFYSHTKKITWLCHYILGAACACAPVGAWLAVTGSLTQPCIVPALVLGAAVCLYVGGFDVLYATQDIAFDRAEHLHSIPARFGLKGALIISALSHAGTIVLFTSLFFIMHRGIIYAAGVFIAAVLLAIEHYNVMPENKKKMIFAAYNMNQIVSAVMFVFCAADAFWRV